MRQRPLAGVAWVLLALTLAAGCSWWNDDRAAIRKRLDDFTRHVNAHASEGLGSVARAAETRSYFTDDAVVDLGQGTAPLEGRDTLMGMAVRLQPRLSEFTLRFVDVNVEVASGGGIADVGLTAEFIRRDQTARQTMDAREFKLLMRLEDGEWRIARVTAVETLR